MIESDLENAAHLLRLKRAFMVTKLCEVRIVTEFNHPPPGFTFSVMIDTSVMQGFNFIGHTIEGCPVVVLRFYG